MTRGSKFVREHKRFLLDLVELPYAVQHSVLSGLVVAVLEHWRRKEAPFYVSDVINAVCDQLEVNSKERNPLGRRISTELH